MFTDGFVATVALTLSLALLGWFAGTYGTIIGAGGGFIMVPALLIVFSLAPQQASATSLTVMVFAAMSGSIAYARQRRIDYRAGITFAIASIPGAWLGANLSSFLQSRVFFLAFALLLWSIAEYLMFNPERRASQQQANPHGDGTVPAVGAPPTVWQRLGLGRIQQRLVTSAGAAYTYDYDARIGLVAAPMIGVLSGLFGIGGGLIFVPVLVQLLRFPVHVATSTSFFVLMITAAGGAVTHAFLGHVQWEFAVPMAIGLIVGGQTGAFASRRLKGTWIIRAGAVGLGIVSIRLLLS